MMAEQVAIVLSQGIVRLADQSSLDRIGLWPGEQREPRG